MSIWSYRNPWAGYRVGPSPTHLYTKSRGCKSATTDLSASCVVIEPPDHQCGDAPVYTATGLVLPLDEAVGYRAVFVIVSRSDGQKRFWSQLNNSKTV